MFQIIHNLKAKALKLIQGKNNRLFRAFNQYFPSIILAILKFKDLVLNNFNLFIQGHKPSIHAIESVFNALEIGHTKIMEISLFCGKAIKPIHHVSFKRRHRRHLINLMSCTCSSFKVSCRMILIVNIHISSLIFFIKSTAATLDEPP